MDFENGLKIGFLCWRMGSLLHAGAAQRRRREERAVVGETKRQGVAMLWSEGFGVVWSEVGERGVFLDGVKSDVKRDDSENTVHKRMAEPEVIDEVWRQGVTRREGHWCWTRSRWSVHVHRRDVHQQGRRRKQSTSLVLLESW